MAAAISAGFAKYSKVFENAAKLAANANETTGDLHAEELALKAAAKAAEEIMHDVRALSGGPLSLCLLLALSPPLFFPVRPSSSPSPLTDVPADARFPPTSASGSQASPRTTATSGWRTRSRRRRYGSLGCLRNALPSARVE